MNKPKSIFEILRDKKYKFFGSFKKLFEKEFNKWKNK